MLSTPDAVRRRVEQLCAEWEASVQAGPSPAPYRVELDELRALYRHNSALFEPEVVGMLKHLAKHVEAGADVLPHGVLEEVLSSTFGFRAFRPGQEAIIRAVLRGRDCLGVMPTGAGKSITFQIPARVSRRPALVISPLIALMKDQVDGLREAGFAATALNSSLEPAEWSERVARARRGEYELIYVAPEGLEAAAGRALADLDLSLIAVDEAHCISQWGHDFRPAYRKLRGLKRRFGKVPILALTATATARVTDDIIEQLGMREPETYRGSFFRPNLRLSALPKAEVAKVTVRGAILRMIQRRKGQSGIVYCLSRKSTESIASYLQKHGVRAGAYHAGLTPDMRSKVQDAFRDDAIDVVVATVAFGMGIDKSNVRFVVHRDMPRSVEGYYQEVGRAGRDGVNSDCILFFSWGEVRTYDGFADELGNEGAEIMRAQTREMYRFGEDAGCRHQRLAAYFGEHIPACEASCDQCDPELSQSARELSVRPRVSAPRPVLAAEGIDTDLFARLKALRQEIARERKVPAYVVFSDATLVELVTFKPKDRPALLAISGVGPTKLERYGDAFLALLREEDGT